MHLFIMLMEIFLVMEMQVVGLVVVLVILFMVLPH